MEIKEAIQIACKTLESCELCPRMCGVNRLKEEKGFCGIGSKAVISTASPHFGEEPVLVGNGGSGTIFFSGCNLGCVFCQNYDISQLHYGNKVEIDDLARIMLQLQKRGCININLVTATHVIPHIIESIHRARTQGLTLPIVYNCGGYESAKSLKLLDGTIDIYMPDAKYMDPLAAKRYSIAEDYPDVLITALKEMHRQVGDLEIRDGIATRGLLVRHLIMPNNVAKSKDIIALLAQKISRRTFVNIMGQYRPTFKANRFHEIGRRITFEEFQEITLYARQQGLRLST